MPKAIYLGKPLSKIFQEYKSVSRDIRPRGINQLLISITKTHKVLSSPTLARRVRWVMQEAGIDGTVFGAHSTRMAMSSKSISLRARLEDVLRSADWSLDSTLKKCYFKPILEMATLVLSFIKA